MKNSEHIFILNINIEQKYKDKVELVSVVVLLY